MQFSALLPVSHETPLARPGYQGSNNQTPYYHASRPARDSERNYRPDIPVATIREPEFQRLSMGPNYSAPRTAPFQRADGYPIRSRDNYAYEYNSSQYGQDRPPSRKLETCNGTQPWLPFIFQFVRIARTFNWSESEKADRLIESMHEDALDHLSYLAQFDDYQTLIGQGASVVSG